MQYKCIRYINHTGCSVCMRSLLHAIESKIERLLSKSYIGPPLPVTQEQINAWNLLSYTDNKPPPLFQKWKPPEWIQKCESGFMLNDQTVCYQRGYCPHDVYTPIMQVFADGFHHSTEQIARIFSHIAFDYIIAIRHHETHEIAAACVVEIRGSDYTKDEIPYLFIYELTTNAKFGRHGLAQQMVHAVDALAYLVRLDTSANNVWHHTLYGKRLFMGLTVDRTDTEKYVNSLVSLYSRCGMRKRTTATPQIDYESFTSFCDRDWCIDRNTAHYIAMWKEVAPNVIYSDGEVSIMKDASQVDNKLRYYHAFPPEKLNAVKRYGIVHPLQRCLHDETIEEIYVPQEKSLTFSRTPPPAGSAVFEVQADCGDMPSFETRISIPAWFAAAIHDGNESRSFV